MTQPLKDNIVHVYEPQYRISELLSVEPLGSLFSEEQIEACQRIMRKARDGFFHNAQIDAETLSAAVADLSLSEDCREALRHIADLATDIGANAAIFGYRFIADVSERIVELCDAPGELEPKQLALIRYLSDALQLGFYYKITHDGGVRGRELVANTIKYVSGKTQQ